MNSISTQLSDYLKNTKDWCASGELQRIQWRNKNKTLATPRSVVRRLEELVEDKILLVEYRNGHAWYRYNDGKESPKYVEPRYIIHPLTGQRMTTTEYAKLA